MTLPELRKRLDTFTKLLDSVAPDEITTLLAYADNISIHESENLIIGADLYDLSIKLAAKISDLPIAEKAEVKMLLNRSKALEKSFSKRSSVVRTKISAEKELIKLGGYQLPSDKQK